MKMTRMMKDEMMMMKGTMMKGEMMMKKGMKMKGEMTMKKDMMMKDMKMSKDGGRRWALRRTKA